MRFMKTTLIACLIICLFAMTSVCAGDANDTAMASDDLNQEELSDVMAAANDDNAIEKTDNEEIISSDDEDDGTFSALEKKINDAAAGSTITLNRDYEWDSNFTKESIEITKALTIDGQGHTLDAKQKSRMFHIKSSNVIIKNFIFKNGYVIVNIYQDNKLGGAVLSDATSGGHDIVNSKVVNCTFKSNGANKGAATAHVSCENCTFEGNAATDKGGAMYGGYATNCIFKGNEADGLGPFTSGDPGGATFDTVIDSCIFKDSKDTCAFTDGSEVYAPTLNVSDFISYTGDTVTFDLRTHGGTRITNGNIAIKVYRKSDDSLVNSYSCLSGDAWTVDLDPGLYYATLDTEYKKFTQVRINLTVRENPNLSVESKEYTYGDTISIPLSYESDAQGTVNITLKGKNKNYTFNNIELNNTISFTEEMNADEYNLTVTYSGDSKYSNVSANAKLTIKKADSTIELKVPELNYGTSVNITATTTGATGIKAEISGGEPLEVKGNVITIPGDLDAGPYGLTVTTMPDANHNPANRTYAIYVNPVDSILNVNNITTEYSIITNLTAVTEGAIGITAKIGDKDLEVKGYTIIISGLDVGNYTLTVTAMPDENHFAVSKNVTITVNKIKTELTAVAVTATYNSNKNLVITLKDGKNDPLSGISITVDLNGKKTYTTDKNGQVKIAVGSLTPKTYTAKITFDGDKNYINSTKEVKVTVNKAKSKITAKNKKFKKSKKTKKYQITLKDANKKAIKKVTVYLKVKGKTYKAKTNSKGKATFKITKLTKKGKHKATIKFKGNSCYKSVSKKVKITVK